MLNIITNAYLIMFNIIAYSCNYVRYSISTTCDVRVRNTKKNNTARF